MDDPKTRGPVAAAALVAAAAAAAAVVAALLLKRRRPRPPTPDDDELTSRPLPGSVAAFTAAPHVDTTPDAPGRPAHP